MPKTSGLPPPPVAVRDEVASDWGDPDVCFASIRKVELPTIADKDLMDRGPSSSLDAELAPGTAKVAQGDPGRAVHPAKEDLTLQGFSAKDVRLLRS
jgi:hypothetical protein